MITCSKYRYQPMRTGMCYSSHDIHDPERKTPCVLYPDNRRDLIFSGEDLDRIAKYPFRPVAFAKLSPRYEMDMHGASGMAGFGRFAVVRGSTILWLDEFQHIETEYFNGEMRYSVQDDRISESAIRLTFISGRGVCGLLMRVDTSCFSEDTELYFVHGGMLGWHTHSPFKMEFHRDMCWGNAIAIQGDHARITLTDDENKLYGLHKLNA